MQLRDRVLNGELPVGKDEASILAGVQLRIEESWPSNARSPSALPSDHLGKLIPISEDAKVGVACFQRLNHCLPSAHISVH